MINRAFLTTKQCSFFLPEIPDPGELQLSPNLLWRQVIWPAMHQIQGWSWLWLSEGQGELITLTLDNKAATTPLGLLTSPYLLPTLFPSWNRSLCWPDLASANPMLSWCKSALNIFATFLGWCKGLVLDSRVIQDCVFIILAHLSKHQSLE